MVSQSNPVQPKVPIELGGKVRHLVFDFNALAQYEDISGKNVLAGDTWSQTSIRDMRLLIWCGLLQEDPPLTLEEVGSMLHLGNRELISNALSEAWGKSMVTVPNDETGDGTSNGSEGAADPPVVAESGTG